MNHPSMLLAASFTTVHAALIAAIAVLLVLSAFFSFFETALSSMNLIRIRTMAENKDWPSFERRASALSDVAREWGYVVYRPGLTNADGLVK